MNRRTQPDAAEEERTTMSENAPDRADAPDLPEALDGLPDREPADSPPATEDPANPDAHGPIVQA